MGLYRVSGSASDLTKLRKSFESNSYEAEQLLKEVANALHKRIKSFLFKISHYSKSCVLI